MSHPTSLFSTLGKALTPTPDVLIHDITTDITLDRIHLTLLLRNPARPKFSGQLLRRISHADFESWVEANELLVTDDTFGTVDHDGEYTERGGRYEISYTEFVMEHVTPADLIAYLLEMEELPYGFDPALLKQHNVTL